MSAVFDNTAWDALNAADADFFGTASCTVTAASGAVCRTTVPKAVPDIRASDIRTISVMPFLRIFGGRPILPTSAIPGYPRGPQFFRTITQVSSISRLSSLMRAL